tara:strand:- start:1007 stop:2710 length:1704 start_codon:yes stop_codon:yes gene_type:complete
MYKKKLKPKNNNQSFISDNNVSDLNDLGFGNVSNNLNELQKNANNSPNLNSLNSIQLKANKSKGSVAQLVPFEDEVALKRGKPMNKKMKETARNQFSVNDQIKGFDKSTLKKPPSPPKAKRGNAIKPETPKQNTGKAVTRSTEENTDIAAMPGISANLGNALGGVAEKDKHGDATYRQMASNATKNVISDGTSKGKGFFGRMKEKAGKAWGGIKSGWKSLWAGKKGKDDRTMKEKGLDVAGQVGNIAKTGAVRGGEAMLNATAGKVGNIGVDAYNAGKSTSDAYKANKMASDRSNNLKGQTDGERDLGTAIAKETRNTHAKQGLKSGVNAVKGGLSVAKTISTLGTADLAEEAGDKLVNGILSAGKKAGGKGLLEGAMGYEKKALGERKDYTLGEAFDGQSKSEAKNLEDYKSIVDGGKGELSEDDKKAATKSRSALIQEGLDRSAGYKFKKKANKKQNKANSMDTSGLRDKMSLKDEAVKYNNLAEKRREGINDGSQTLKPGNVKKRTQDMKKVKALGDDLRASDSGFTDNLVKNEDATHNRAKLVTERITEKADELVGKPKKYRS